MIVLYLYGTGKWEGKKELTIKIVNRESCILSLRIMSNQVLYVTQCWKLQSKQGNHWNMKKVETGGEPLMLTEAMKRMMHEENFSVSLYTLDELRVVKYDLSTRRWYPNREIRIAYSTCDRNDSNCWFKWIVYGFTLASTCVSLVRHVYAFKISILMNKF